jgi:hypothetical protein
MPRRLRWAVPTWAADRRPIVISAEYYRSLVAKP